MQVLHSRRSARGARLRLRPFREDDLDALAALVNGLGAELQGAEGPLKQTLAQLQMAYAQRATAPPGS